jgi:tRNA(Ile)-lysidine synthase
VRDFFQGLDPVSGPLVVAVSGGPDSVALVRALASLRDELGLRPLILAHLNHRLRGAESDADEAFVRELHEQLAAVEPAAFQLQIQSADVLAQKLPGEGVEGTARVLRYRWLVEAARAGGARRVATGHTADDQAETVLHRLLRGTGVKGLAGIPALRPLAHGIEVIRPLLEVGRAEVLDYLAQLGQTYRQDSSNIDRRFTRNRIRHELLPLLARDYNPAVVDVLYRLARQARALQEGEELRARQLLEQAELPRAGALLVFAADCLRDVSSQQISEMFRLVWRREDWSQQHMGFREWQRLARVARGEAKAADLPGPIRARHRGRAVQVGPVK